MIYSFSFTINKTKMNWDLTHKEVIKDIFQNIVIYKKISDIPLVPPEFIDQEPTLNDLNDYKIIYKPILLGGLHNLGGITAPAFNVRKMKNMKNDCELIAKKNKIIFKWNDKFPINSLYLMRGYLVLSEKLKEKYFEVCFDNYWKENTDLSSEENIHKIFHNN